jgi:hypothetical protein
MWSSVTKPLKSIRYFHFFYAPNTWCFRVEILQVGTTHHSLHPPFFQIILNLWISVFEFSKKGLNAARDPKAILTKKWIFKVAYEALQTPQDRFKSTRARAHTRQQHTKVEREKGSLREFSETFDWWENPSRYKHNDHKEEPVGHDSGNDNPTRTTLVNRDSAAARHRRYSRKATCIRDHTCVEGVAERSHTTKTTPPACHLVALPLIKHFHCRWSSISSRQCNI